MSKTHEHEWVNVEGTYESGDTVVFKCKRCGARKYVECNPPREWVYEL